MMRPCLEQSSTNFVMNCLHRETDISGADLLLVGTDTPLGADLTMRLRDAASVLINGDGGCHGIDHSDRVHTTSLLIGQQMDARLDILSAAAILHDIGRNEEHKSRGEICHAAHGSVMAADLLTDIGFDTDDVEEICHCIATHRYRDNNPPASLEAQILFDADKLDSIGAIGIGRAFLFAGQVGARLHNTEADINNSSPYTIEDTAYREFMVKLCRVKDRMITPLGRQMAAERHDFMEDFFSRLETEIRMVS